MSAHTVRYLLYVTMAYVYKKDVNLFSKKPKCHEIQFKIRLCLECIQALFVFLLILWILLLNMWISSIKWSVALSDGSWGYRMLYQLALYPVAKPSCTLQRAVPLDGILSLVCTSSSGFILQMHAFLLSVGWILILLATWVRALQYTSYMQFPTFWVS